MSELSEPLENYLKEIYELEETKGNAKVVDLIEAFSISPGTISKALDRLESLGFIDRKSRRIRLTEDGKRLAVRLIRSHRLSERLLTDVIGLDWIRAHELAHRLEHIWPEDVLDKIDEVVGHPKTCPHGHPIPGREEQVEGIQLSEAKPGEYTVLMIVKEKEWILRMADSLGLLPGRKVRVVQNSRGEVKIQNDDRESVVPRSLTEQVIVRGTQ
ncbi:Transcriptional regulator MntR [Metallosphaera sp. J1]|uniref:metal-dependent transcriptional regulator n=1 Tax=Metallosphaera TaxID=41980 RepID=UPI001EDF0B62|nr:metal-dependent transcriptional regulator [Metallosphaera javensis (ex Hofmann et al. 2022)]MCG3108602.1 Transcriptional regulator MntR [Metallosphaera javensis (ex Hofmann et al. 2022)]BCS91709.1 MAG: transcriptional regulator MntR [Metallosphaera javensis (ex Sakai et al. 2022)]